MIDTVIFDLDGTLLYTIEDLTDGVNYAMVQCGYPTHSVEAVRSMVGNGIRNLIIRAIPEGEENPHFEAAFQCFKEYYTEHCLVRTRPYDGMVQVLQTLKKKGIRTAIVTNKNHQAAQKLKDYFFKDLIDTVVGQTDGVLKKPEPDMVVQAMKKLGASAETSIYVGDSEVDYETARNSQMKGVIVSWGFRNRTDLESLPDVLLVDTPSQLLDKIEHMK